jgi:hypothetical protein
MVGWGEGATQMTTYAQFYNHEREMCGYLNDAALADREVQLRRDIEVAKGEQREALLAFLRACMDTIASRAPRR